ncbi:MAG: hypothetical protein ISR65_04950 [Bacteriovoracaceae bacterium]|nr:hypothetical protein [Bacteriovoracaceae bacterium]
MTKITLLWSLLFSLYVFAAKNDVDYYFIERNGFQYIFPMEYIDQLPRIILINEKLSTIYERNFDWKLDEMTSLVIKSSNNQIPNATATTSPFNLTTLNGGGIYMIDKFAESSWGFGLLTHELSHIYQINPKQGLAKWSKNIFGNNMFLTIPPVFVTPNRALPRWILEGNAVMNECRFGNGGRLYSGQQWALFLSLVKHKVLDKTRIINNHLSFPFAAEKYIVGGYFNLFLADKFGMDKTNGYFLAHSNHYWNPLQIDKSFREHFGSGYYQLWDEFLAHYDKIAQGQSHSYAKTLGKSVYLRPMNRIGNEVFGLLSNDGKSTPTLFKYNVLTGSYKEEVRDLPLGKIFKLKDSKLYTAAYGEIDRKFTKFSLWGTRSRYKREYLSKIVQDIKGDDVLYFDANKSFFESNLYKNDSLVGGCHSSALLDELRNYYCFKQLKNRRTLLKNNKPLFSFAGFYGKVVDVDKQDIYFIATTKFGSTLFKYNKKQSIVRLSALDTIVDAKKIGDNEFLVAEVTPNGYQYKVEKTGIIKGNSPYYHKITDKNHKESQLYLNTLKVDDSIQFNKQNIKKFNFLKNMRFSHWNINYLIDRDSFMKLENRLEINANFTDPLRYNSLSVSGLRDFSSEVSRIYLVYSNQKNLIRWRLSTGFLDYQDSRDKFIAGAAIDYPFFDFDEYITFFGSSIYYEYIKDSKGIIPSIYIGIKRSKYYSLGFSPYQSFALKLGYKVDYVDDFKEIFASGHMLYDFGKENIAAVDFELKNTSERTSQIGDYSAVVPHLKYSLSTSLDNPSVNRVRLGLMYKKVVNSSLYFAVFPFSLRRFAPLVLANFYYDTLNSPLYSQLTYELGGGIESELLNFHIAVSRLNLYVFARQEGELAIKMTLKINL